MNAAEIILEYAHQHDIRLWADRNLLRIDAPKRAMTPEFRDNLKRYKPEIIQTLQDPSRTTRIVQENLRMAVPTLVNMQGIGQAYWVRDEAQRDELQTALLAQGDDTPVFAWGELLLIKDWSLDDKQNIYQLKRQFQSAIRESGRGADG